MAQSDTPNMRTLRKLEARAIDAVEHSFGWRLLNLQQHFEERVQFLSRIVAGMTDRMKRLEELPRFRKICGRLYWRTK